VVTPAAATELAERVVACQTTLDAVDLDNEFAMAF